MSNLENQSDKNERYKLIKEYPKNTLPKEIEKIIEEYCSILNLNYGYACSSVLIALSIAIGNYAVFKIKEDWKEIPVLWMIFVGKSGINKSSPLKTFLGPIIEMDVINFDKYILALNEYKSKIILISNQSKKEKSNSHDIPKLPKLKQFIVRDFTPEALFDILNDNNGRVGIYSEELLSWLNSLNRYNKSGIESTYLSIWSGDDISKNRTSSNPIYIKKPTVPICGTIQPEMFQEAFGKNRDKSGFTGRILFEFPENVKREDLAESDISDTTRKNYKSIINNILKLSESNSDIPKNYEFNDASKLAFKEWRHMNNCRINNDSRGVLSGIYSKIEINLLRITLILQILEDVLNQNHDNKYINLSSFKSAVKIVKYYEYTNLKVHKLISKFDDPLKDYSFDKKIVYRSLSERFETRDGVLIAEKNGMIERTFKNFIKDDNLFEKVKHGFYSKKI